MLLIRAGISSRSATCIALVFTPFLFIIINMNINAISADCNCTAMQNAVLYFYVTNLMNAIDYVTLQIFRFSSTSPTFFLKKDKHK